MSDRKNYGRLGLFVLVALGALFGVLFILGGRALFQPTYEFETYFDESVAGLDLGAAVSFRGVPLGQVSDIALSTTEYEYGVPLDKRRNYIVVRAKVSLERYRVERLAHEAPAMIKAGLRAQTQLAGITGQQFLALDMLDPAKYPPLPFEWVPKYTYLPSARSLTSAIIANVQTFLSQLDKADVQKLAANLDALAATLNRKASELPVAELSAELSSVLKAARQAVGHIDGVVTRPEVEVLLRDLAAASGHLDGLLANPGLKQSVDNVAEVTERLRKLAASGELDRTVRRIDEVAARINNMVRDNQYDVRVIVQDLRGTADNLRTLSDNLKRNPGGLLLGGPPERIQLPGKTP